MTDQPALPLDIPLPAPGTAVRFTWHGQTLRGEVLPGRGPGGQLLIRRPDADYVVPVAQLVGP